jgi:hypothetical protein
MKFVFSILLVLHAAIGNADSAAPPSCTPLVVKDESIILTTKKPILVLIHNSSKGDLWITHPISEPSASAGWSSRLQADHWSALALNKESFELSCIESKPGHEQQVPCAGAISVCLWSSVQIPTEGSGTFWAGEDMSLNSLMEHLGGRGFKLPNHAE